MNITDCDLFTLEYAGEVFGYTEQQDIQYNNLTDLLMAFHQQKMTPINNSYELAINWYAGKEITIFGFQCLTVDKDKLNEAMENTLRLELLDLVDTKPNGLGDTAIKDFMQHVRTGMAILDRGNFHNGAGVSYTLNGAAIADILNG